MADLFDYLKWRGDLSFHQVPPTPVDALILSVLAYIDFSGIVPDTPSQPIPLETVCRQFLALPEPQARTRTGTDTALLQAAVNTPRFAGTKLTFYRSRLIPEEETQVAAMSFLLDDGTAFLAFRGTDYSLTGWKEDFNMSFQDSVPAQREAAIYVEALAAAYPLLLRLGGHSKGGNLAVYAAAKVSPGTGRRIRNVYNLDGPGFTDSLMGDPGYLQMVPKIQTYIPESSIIGMLLEHEEPYSVIKSRQISILQHEPYSWEVLGGNFIAADSISPGILFADKAIKNWIAGMSREERSAFVDALFTLLEAGGANRLRDLLHPKSILAAFKAFNTNESTRKLLTGEFLEVLKAAAMALDRRNK